MAELEREGKVFLDHVQEWRKEHLGEFVLIKGSDVVGFFHTLKEAFDVGSKTYGLDPFFVRQISPEDAVNVSFYGERILSS